MDSISSTVKHNDMNIVETGLLLLEKILSAFQAPKFECFYKVHFFTIEKDVLEVLMISCHGSNLEHLALELLQNLFTLVDKLSQPLWDSETTPVHYNPVFVMEHTTKFFVSACKEMASKEVRKLVDKVFDAKNDTTLFKQNTRELISALKQPPESVLDLNTVPSLNEKECSSSGLYAARASFIKTFKEQFKAFLEDFIESGDHSAHYKGVVYGMYGTGSTDMKISLEHIKIYRSGLARDLTRSFDSVQSAIIEAASEYAFGIIQELDSKLRMSESVPPVHPLLRGASARVSIVDMPRRMITFLEFIASPGNEIVTRQTIFGGPNSIAIENQTDVGTRAIFGYLDHLTSVHVQGYSWDGKFTQENFMVSDDEKFEICKSKCGSCSQQNKMNDYTQFEKEFLTLYGEASFIPVLALPMKHPLEKFPSTDAERLRVEYVTHPGGRPPVIRTALLLDLYRAWKFLRSQGKKSLKSVFDIICDWRKKVKANSLLKKIYDYVKVDPTLLAILRDLPEIAIKKLSPGFGLIEGEHNHGDDIYDDTLLLFIIFVRHAIIHVADPACWTLDTTKSMYYA
ncbi:uncharacterized protein LOC125512156 isoform X1 [Triticum urartu]|nr:uncharacterized protein LOC125512156 isoform X1 [Triticum urartu]